MLENQLIKLTKHDFERAAKIFFRAYKEYPVWLHLIPNEVDRKPKFLSLWGFFVKFNLKYGQVYANSPKFEGVVSITHSDDMNTSLLK